MNRLIGVIHLDREQDLLKELTYFRCGAAVPFGGRYRLIDFMLSNMVHSRMEDIAVFTRHKYRSLLDHLGTGKSWGLDRKRGGLFILPPDWNDPTDLSKGELQHFHNNRDFFDRGHGDYVLITGTQQICKINFQDVFQKHLQSNADLTFIYKRVTPEAEYDAERKLEFDKAGKVVQMTTDANNPNLYMGMFIIRKSLLLEIVDFCISRQKEHLLDGIMSQRDLTIEAYEYDGYLAVINSIESYFKHSMSLLNTDLYHTLFLTKQPILTKVKDEPPTRYKEKATVKNSLIADGCVIEGTVENSILFHGVHVHPHTTIRNSIIMQRCDIQEGTIMENVILDKDVSITPKHTLIGAPKQPYLVAKRQVLQ